jgi:hypothetical protein
MRSRLLCVAVAALILASPAAAGLPRHGLLIPGRSLGGIRLGDKSSAVRAKLGTFYGVCRDCATRTWYFTYRTFDRHGLAVEFTRGRVSAVYTLWQPRGWHGLRGLQLGARPLTVHQRAGPLDTIVCPGYDALFADFGATRTVYYVFGGRLWGFGLFARGAQPCR